MTFMLSRRGLIAGFAALVAALHATRAKAQDSTAATSFVLAFGTKLLDVVNGAGALPEKVRRIRPLIDSAVDVETIAHFCLGRYASVATPKQVDEFTALFHAVLVNNITSKIGEFRGVTFRMADSSVRGNDAFVGTVVQRPNSAPVSVRWVVSTLSGNPKIVDVVAEGTSLRLTQRSDYASFLSRNGASVDALIAAMRRQVADAVG